MRRAGSDRGKAISWEEWWEGPGAPEVCGRDRWGTLAVGQGKKCLPMAGSWGFPVRVAESPVVPKIDVACMGGGWGLLTHPPRLSSRVPSQSGS